MTFGREHGNGAEASHGYLGAADPRSTATRRGTVMLVDDDPTLRTLLRLTLPSDEFEVTEAADGSEALELLDESTPDLLVLDWNMPERSGGEVLAELRRRGLDIPVIVLTAERDVRNLAVARSLGAAAFLTKPFSPLRLLDAIERLVADRAPDQPA